jgi:hypothetical protein
MTGISDTGEVSDLEIDSKNLESVGLAFGKIQNYHPERKLIREKVFSTFRDTIPFSLFTEIIKF